MIGPTIVAKVPRGFVGRYEVDLLLMYISISLFLTGLGRIRMECVLKRELFAKAEEIVLLHQQ